MTREETVRVRTKDGSAIAFSAGQKYGLKLAAGETASQWMDGSPITRAEFEDVLKPHGPFETADEHAAAQMSAAAPPAPRSRTGR